VLRYHSLHYY